MLMYPEKTVMEKDRCNPEFTAARFTTGRTWKQPKCPSTDEDKNVVHIYNEILLSPQKN